ncbi:hypothetical protein EELLY_v1c01120 [Entomoplasma ellychniae]|uniref:Uncharacterized protein n=1 Tax=Entomoplasma ellychniae TaxID=2114 RepID=A0A8E2QVH2_9MOLU|nr:hypothetical protein [Entomoplasma ellychniae]PPE04437.1 hypothetical protein EELLY_v1c01120 [Entomoplasma ellychniae]
MKGGDIIKKIDTKKAKEIIGGASASGALLNGVAAIIGKATDFLLDIAALPLVYIESSKNHDKAKFKLGSTSIEFDDTASVKNQPQLSHHDSDFVQVQTLKSISNDYNEHNQYILMSNEQEEYTILNPEVEETINYFG